MLIKIIYELIIRNLQIKFKRLLNMFLIVFICSLYLLCLNLINGYQSIHKLSHTTYKKISSKRFLTINENNVIKNLVEKLQSKQLLNIDQSLNPLNNEFLTTIQSYLTSDSKNFFPFQLSDINDNLLNIQNTILSTDLQSNIISNLNDIVVNPYFLPTFTISYALSIIFGYINNEDDMVGSPYDDNNFIYSQKVSDDFYSTKPLYLFRRVTKLLTLTNTLSIKLLFDWLFKNLEKNQQSRAEEALSIITQLGPTFIKLGIYISILSI